MMDVGLMGMAMTQGLMAMSMRMPGLDRLVGVRVVMMTIIMSM